MRLVPPLEPPPLVVAAPARRPQTRFVKVFRHPRHRQNLHTYRAMRLKQILGFIQPPRARPFFSLFPSHPAGLPLTQHRVKKHLNLLFERARLLGFKIRLQDGSFIERAFRPAATGGLVFTRKSSAHFGDVGSSHIHPQSFTLLSRYLRPLLVILSNAFAPECFTVLTGYFGRLLVIFLLVIFQARAGSLNLKFS